MQQKPRLSLFEFTMLMISFVIGMGIFRTPANVAANAANPFIFYAAWLAGGLVALCGALTYAEIGSRYPVTGGYYKIFSYAYHPSIAFAVNCIILVSNAASLAGVALVGAEYVSSIFFSNSPGLKTIQIVFAIACIIIFYSINLLGLKVSARTQNVLSAIKIGLILFLVLPLLFGKTADLPASSIVHHANPAFIEFIRSFGICLVAVSFTYGGYQQSINFGEEVSNPTKTVPRAIAIGIGIIILLYLLINFAYMQVIGFENLKTAKNISAIMATTLFGNVGGRIVSALLFLSVLGYVNAVLLSNPRVMQAMSEDGVLPSAFGKRSASKNVLVTALSVFAALSTLIVFWAETFDAILSFTIFLDCIGMALSAATIFKLRKETAHLNGTGIYQMKMYPLLPLIFIFAYTLVAVSIFIDKPMTALLGLGILAVFVAIYFAVSSRKKSN